MIRIGILGDIGSGKSHIAKKFGYPVFNADDTVSKIYKNNRKCYLKIRKILPNHIKSFPVKKDQLLKAILVNYKNIKKIIKIVHPEVRASMNIFLKKNKNKKAVILDIPLFLENKMNKKKDILIFINARKKEIDKRLKKRPNYNIEIIKQLKKLQLPLEIKKKYAHFIIKNNFNNKYVEKSVKELVKKILLND
mgnify:FL=1|tara:strand:+ start:723 stop:1301 length:579 start_codon:yes stop_codon:yes gene_type:complete